MGAGASVAGMEEEEEEEEEREIDVDYHTGGESCTQNGGEALTSTPSLDGSEQAPLESHNKLANEGKKAKAKARSKSFKAKKKGRVPLEILNDPRWCSSFRSYIVEAFKQDLQASDMDPPSAEKVKELAFNYLQFWLDVSDFNLLADSTFRSIRGEGICEKYLGHGAKMKIPLPRLIVEEILLNKDVEGFSGGGKETFAAAQEEAYEYMEAEVFPFFTKNDGDYGYTHVEQIIRMSDRVRKNAELTRGGSARDIFNTMKQDLSTILWDPVSCKYFKEFLEKRGASELILFFLETVDFRDMLTAVLQDQGAKKERSYRYFLMRATKIYDKYLKLGSTLRTSVREKDISDMIDLVSNQETMSPEVFDKLREWSLDFMLLEHFADFKESTESKVLKEDTQARAIRRQSLLLGDGQSLYQPTEADRQAMKEMILTNPRCFQQYLNQHKEGNLLLFYQEVEEYKTIPLSQTNFIKGRAHKMFDKYIKRGSSQELNLDLMIRADVVRHIDGVKLEAFDRAQAAVFDIMLREEWPVFKTTELYEQYRKEQGLNKKAGVIDTALGRAGAATEAVSLDAILASSAACACFKKFCETEFCVEPLLFWLDIEEYKRLPRSEFLQRFSRKIINRYVKDGAPTPVTIAQDTRQQILLKAENVGPAIFQTAQAEVYFFLGDALLPKFRRTEEYQEMLKILMEEDKAQASKSAQEIDMSVMSPSGAGGGGSGKGGDARGSLERRFSDPKKGKIASGATGAGGERTLDSENYDSIMANYSLKEIMQEATGIKFFKEFLIARHCEENIFFWLEAEDFKNIPGSDYMKIHARKIVAKYVNENARQQINIDDRTRKALIAQLENPTRTIFNKAQEEVLKIMQRDSWPPFLESEQFKAYRELVEGNTESGFIGILRRGGPNKGKAKTLNRGNSTVSKLLSGAMSPLSSGLKG